MTGRCQLVVALDVADGRRAAAVAASLRGHADLVKVGLQLYTAAGPSAVSRLVDGGWRVFLDLKLHDIPATVAGAVRAAGELGVELLTVHAAGGPRMLEAATAARSGTPGLRLLAVTLLTSLDAPDLRRLGLAGTPGEVVARWAALAHGCGCDGVVASPREVATIKARHGRDFLVAAAGVRPRGWPAGDQARTAGVAEAVAAGADYLVVGRPVLGAPDPAAAAAAIRAEIGSVHVRG